MIKNTIKKTFKKIETKNAKLEILTLGFIIILFSSFSLMLFAKADSSYSDSVDDLRCFTEDDIENIEEFFDDVEDPRDIADTVLEIWDTGTISATPDCVDMTLISFEDEWGDNVKLTITVEGQFSDCPFAVFLIWGNCSEGDFIAFIMIETTMDEGGNQETNSYYGYANEDGDEDSGNADMNEGMNEVSITYPEPDVDCSLFIMGMATDETHELLCIDLFPNSLYESNPFDPTDPNNPFFEEPEGENQYNGWDPITNFIDNVSYLIFGVMCGRLGFLLLISMLTIVFKVIVDRKNEVVRSLGGVGEAFVAWVTVWYMFDINFSVPDPVLEFSLLALLDMLTCVFILVFVAYTFANQYKYVNDGEWSWVLAYAFMIIETVLFLTPWWFYSCAGQPTLTLVYQIICLIPCVAAFFVTEYYSKGRLP